MDYTILGRTGLKVSVAGLGSGGPSRLGQRQHKTEQESVLLVRQALDMGVNLIDTAESYGTEQRRIIDTDACDDEDPLEFVLKSGDVSSLPEAAYRYCRHEPRVHVVLTGTGNPDHLKANLESLSKPPLDESVCRRLREIFVKVDSVSGS